MVFIKDNYSQEKYEAVFGECWIAMWQKHVDISKPDKMAECLALHLDAEDVRKIMQSANKPEVKQKLNAITQMVLDSGAYGCPWYLVTNKEGVTEPFFGSDRFHYMWSFLQLPWQDIAILQKSNL